MTRARSEMLYEPFTELTADVSDCVGELTNKAMIGAGIHVSHGFWSAFQTVGASHPKYMPLVRSVGLLFSLIVGIGFGAIPIYVYVVIT